MSIMSSGFREESGFQPLQTTDKPRRFSAGFLFKCVRFVVFACQEQASAGPTAYAAAVWGALVSARAIFLMFWAAAASRH
ncbi:hypothetical protein, partial [Nitratireductor aquibiodomus]|uniref:hypothetical protein n=1 Tax=Nitratireductor aquibiodomus TaxID=204799 RepID=UPI001AEC4CFE